MDVPADVAALRQRQESYLSSHYLSMHATVVSLALGVAAVVAGSLVAGSPSPKFDGYQPIFYVLWASSLLVIGVAYGGPMIGAFLLPARVPAVLDFVAPMLIAVCEFMLFTVLGYRITQWTTPRSVLIGWWFILATFGLVAMVQVGRARFLVAAAEHGPATAAVFRCQQQRLKSNLKGAACVTSLALVGGCYYALVEEPWLWLSYLLATASAVGHALGLVGHRKTAKALREALDRLPHASVRRPNDRRHPRARLIRGHDPVRVRRHLRRAG